jgi:hypothetical protein
MTIDKSSTIEPYLEVPGGILTSSGIFYNIDSKGIDQLIPGLLEKVKLADLLKEADAKAVSPYFLAYHSFLLGLLFSVWIAFGALLIAYILGLWFRSIFSGPIKGYFHRIVTQESIFILLSGGVLIFFGYHEHLLQLGLGLGMFVAFRLLLILSRGNKKNTIPNKNDRILHFVLHWYALHEGLSSSHIDEMQEKILHYYNRSAHKKKHTHRS